MQFVVLCSSRGTTFQAVIDRMRDGTLTAECRGLISDRADRGCVEKAKMAGLPVRIVEKKDGESREDYDRRLEQAVTSLAKGELVIAALGWFGILTPWFIERHRNRIINVHPALLPKYGGRNMFGDRVHQAVLDAGEQQSGITIHLMDEGVDTGKILLQKMCPVQTGDTVETLKVRVQGLEKEWYPKVLQMIDNGELKL